MNIFIESIILKPENEKYIFDTFSPKNLKRVQLFNNQRKDRTKRLADRKLILSGLL